MITSHHIATQLVAERQRDLRAVRTRPRWRLTALFARSPKPELESVPPARATAPGVDGPAPAGVSAAVPVAQPQLRVRRGTAVHVPSGARVTTRARTPERTGC